MEAKSKQEYIEQWKNHIQTLGILTFCKDEKLANEIHKHIKELKELVVKVADIKYAKENKKMEW